MIAKLLSRVRTMREPMLVLLLGIMLIPVQVASDLYLGNSAMPGTLSSLGLVGAAIMSLRIGSRLSDYVIATSVVAEVMVVRASISLSDRSRSWPIGIFLKRRRFSRTLS